MIEIVRDGDPGEVRDWIFTFGVNDPAGHHFVRIHGTFHSAREEMVRRYERKWAFQYESEEAAGVDRFGLTELR